MKIWTLIAHGNLERDRLANRHMAGSMEISIPQLVEN
jgi:hypothetical protein